MQAGRVSPSICEKCCLKRRTVRDEVVQLGGGHVAEAGLTVEVGCDGRAPAFQLSSHSRRDADALLVAAQHGGRRRCGDGGRHRRRHVSRHWGWKLGRQRGRHFSGQAGGKRGGQRCRQ